MNAQIKTKVRLSALSLAIALGSSVSTGCGRADLGELQAYIDEVNGRVAPVLESVPVFAPPEWAAAPSTRVDPFKSFDAAEKPFVEPDAHPDRHAPQALERYALDTLRMVGIMEFAGEIRALIQAPDGVVHRVSAGNYLGENAGKVTYISETGVELREIIADPQGQWIERNASIDLRG